jgi:hypothetical protein
MGAKIALMTKYLWYGSLKQAARDTGTNINYLQARIHATYYADFFVGKKSIIERS